MRRRQNALLRGGAERTDPGICPGARLSPHALNLIRWSAPVACPVGHGLASASTSATTPRRPLASAIRPPRPPNITQPQRYCHPLTRAAMLLVRATCATWRCESLSNARAACRFLFTPSARGRMREGSSLRRQTFQRRRWPFAALAVSLHAIHSPASILTVFVLCLVAFAVQGCCRASAHRSLAVMVCRASASMAAASARCLL